MPDRAVFLAGRRSAVPYEARFTAQFLRATRKEDADELRRICEEITSEPYVARGSEPLSYEWAGFRAAVFDRKKRIIYRICEECIRKHQKGLAPLACCLDPNRPERVVTFVDFGDYHASAGRRRLKPAREYGVVNPEVPPECD